MSTASSTVSESPALRRSLGLPYAVLFGLAYMVPLTVFTTYGIVSTITSGHLALAYIITLTAMLVTALSYARMVKALPVAGSAYTYTQRSFGPNLGFLVGWSLLLDYLFLPMINFMIIGLYLNAAIPALPAWLIIVATIVIVTAMNVLGIKVAAGFNSMLVGIQVVFIVVFVIMSVVTLTAQDAPIDPLAPFANEEFQFAALIAGAAVLCLSFLGFDAVSTLSEETKDPTRTIPRAILICTFSAGLIFIFLSWLGHLVFPDWTAYSSVDTAATDVMARAGGAFLVAFFTAAFISGGAASATASHVSVTRILYTMGRDGAMPGRIFAVLHPKFRTPYLAALAVGAVSLLALVLPLELAAAMISFGALIAFTFVNLSVIKYHAVDRGRRHGGDLIRFVVLPAIGVTLCLWLWTSLSPDAFMVGLGWVGVGLVWLLVITRGLRRPAPTMDLQEVEDSVVPSS
ncbi:MULTISPECIES: APC family permease [unclassified Nesterenkonia]|uniref:APC family permease n=1 Tax=unclassified Nesterenkonia TaxID=2629769 RepID=UPI00087240CC|nr:MULTISPECIES: amino acid permease [unclassified Nesterenkonia]MDS2172613.1 amino acid permease [Nesterenkonia sp. CL21]OSM44175.1 Putrescine importer PuuP [Nesterenkonia sp. PF2B19]